MPVLQSGMEYQDQYFNVKNKILRGYIREIDFDEVAIVRYTFLAERSASAHFEIAKDKVVLLFNMEGAIEAVSSALGYLSINSGMHNVIYTNPINGSIKLNHGKHDLFYISLPLELFRNYFPKGEESFQSFNHKMSKGHFSKLRPEHGVINHDIYRIIEDICRCEQDQSVKKIFIQAKIMELLAIQLDQMCTICCPTCAMRKVNADKMYTVRDFILNHIGETHSLKVLARSAGTNDFTLKKEFKELFGTTVFGFWTDVKMEKAQELLVEGKTTVKEISEIVGYKNPQHFSTAFKRKFGETPTAYQKNMVSNFELA